MTTIIISGGPGAYKIRDQYGQEIAFYGYTKRESLTRYKKTYGYTRKPADVIDLTKGGPNA